MDATVQIYVFGQSDSFYMQSRCLFFVSFWGHTISELSTPDIDQLSHNI